MLSPGIGVAAAGTGSSGVFLASAAVLAVGTLTVLGAPLSADSGDG